MIIAMVSCTILGILLFICGDYIQNALGVEEPVVFYLMGLIPFIVYIIITIIFLIVEYI